MSRYPDQEKRERILRASMEFFGQHGYKKATIKSIADKVGVAPGTIYTYFEDKDELFLATIMEIWDLLIKKVEQVQQETSRSYKTRFAEVYDTAEALILQSHSLLLGMFSVSDRRKLLRSNLDRLTQSLLPLFQEGVRQGFNMPDAQGEQALFQIRIIISGVLFELSLVENDELSTSLKKLRKAVEREFFQTGGTKAQS